MKKIADVVVAGSGSGFPPKIVVLAVRTVREAGVSSSVR
jgi:hypothetical protein